MQAKHRLYLSVVAASICAAVILPASAWAQGAGSSGAEASPAANDAQKAAAAEQFKAAKALFEERKYVQAIVTFEKAYALHPHFLVQCSIARCYENLGNMVQAADYFQRCLKDGADDAPMAIKVRAALRNVTQQVTWVTVRSPEPGGTVYRDGVVVGKSPQRLALNPGTTAVEVRRKGADPARSKVTTLGGETLTLILAPQPRPEPVHIATSGALTQSDVDRKAAPLTGISVPAPARKRGLNQAWFWTVAGTSVALAATATVLSIQTVGLQEDYNTTPTEAGYDRFVGRRTASNILWGLTAAAAAGGTVLFFYTDFSGNKQNVSERQERSYYAGIRGAF